MTTVVLIYPIFQDCGEYTFDPFWKDTFYNCACNRFPKNMSYNSKDRTIKVKIGTLKGRMEVTDLPTDIIEAFKTMMFVFREKLQLFSPRDIQTQTRLLESMKDQNRVDMNCEWKKLKPRTLKDELVMNFVENMTTQKELSSREARSLLITIQLGFQNNKITAEHVDYSSGVINDISGLEYNEDSNQFYITNTTTPVVKTEKVVTGKRFYQNIDRFVREYKNQTIRNV